LGCWFILNYYYYLDLLNPRKRRRVNVGEEAICLCCCGYKKQIKSQELEINELKIQLKLKQEEINELHSSNRRQLEIQNRFLSMCILQEEEELMIQQERERDYNVWFELLNKKCNIPAAVIRDNKLKIDESIEKVCVGCNKRENLEKDHIIELQVVSSILSQAIENQRNLKAATAFQIIALINNMVNGQWLCSKCNKAKRNHIYDAINNNKRNNNKRLFELPKEIIELTFCGLAKECPSVETALFLSILYDTYQQIYQNNLSPFALLPPI